MVKRKPEAEQKNDEIARALAAGDHKALAAASLKVLEADPEDVRALGVLGELMRKQGKFAQAVKLLDRAVSLAPQAVVLQGALGEALLEAGELESALAVLRRAAALAPDDAAVCRHAGRVLQRLGRYEEALAAVECGLGKSPRNAHLLLLSGQIMIGLQRMDEAKQRLKLAMQLVPEDPWPHLGLALIHMLRGELARGFAEYRWRQKLPECQPRKFPQPAWLGGDAMGKTILVYAEQGLGDVLHFARYLPLLAAKGARVLLICDATLHPLLRRMEGVTLVQPHVKQEFDCHASLLDLPDLFGTTLENLPARVPYLQASSQRRLPPPLPGTRLRVGIVWAGNPKHNNTRNRDCTVERFLPLAGRNGVEMFSLQVGKAAAALHACGGDVLVTPLGPHLTDMDVTASALAELDLLITVDTAVAHLAGALGRPVWTLLQYAPDWRWMLGRDDTPWYPTMRLFRQPASRDWESVFVAVEKAFDELLKARNPLAAPSGETMAQARQLRDRAIAAHEGGNNQGARALQRDALRLNPLDPGMWNNMGIYLREEKHFLAAEVCYRRGLACGGGKDAGLRTNLGNALNDLDRCAEAVACHEASLAQSATPLALQNLGVSLRGAGRHEEAVKVYDKVIEAAPDNFNARWDRSQSLLALGRFEEGWRDYESRWKLKDAGPYPRKGPRWEGKPFKRKTLVLAAEQGFGDTLLAARFLPQVKRLGGRVLLECQPELMRLLGKTGWVDGMFAKGTPPPEPYDFQLPMMSLPGLFVPDAAAIPHKPYLKADPAGHAMFANLLKKEPGRLNVGIVWSGSVTFKGNAYRAAGLESFLRFAAVPGVRLFSLQKGPPHEELKKLGLPSLVTDLSPLLLDFECTAAALEMLDLVIMTDSATAHLAGALGVPVWVLLGSRPYWLWGEKDETSSWYPSMRFLRQRATGDWEELFARAEGELRALAAKQA